MCSRPEALTSRRQERNRGHSYIWRLRFATADISGSRGLERSLGVGTKDQQGSYPDFGVLFRVIEAGIRHQELLSGVPFQWRTVLRGGAAGFDACELRHDWGFLFV